LGRELIIVCPRCHAQDKVNIEMFSPEFGGLRRIALIHRGHVLIVDIDSSLFIRGAYITPYSHIVGTSAIFRNHVVLTDIILEKNFEFVVYRTDQGVIDIRACPECLAYLYEVLSSIVEYKAPDKYAADHQGFITISDKTFVVEVNPPAILFGLLSDNDGCKETKISWFEALCKIFKEKENIQTRVLRDIIEYVVENLSHPPSPEDVSRLNSFLDNRD